MVEGIVMQFLGMTMAQILSGLVIYTLFMLNHCLCGQRADSGMFLFLWSGDPLQHMHFIFSSILKINILYEN